VDHERGIPLVGHFFSCLSSSLSNKECPAVSLYSINSDRPHWMFLVARRQTRPSRTPLAVRKGLRGAFRWQTSPLNVSKSARVHSRHHAGCLIFLSRSQLQQLQQSVGVGRRIYIGGCPTSPYLACVDQSRATVKRHSLKDKKLRRVTVN